MKNLFSFLLFCGFLILSTPMVSGQDGQAKAKESGEELKTYLIERELPGAGSLDHRQLQGISKTSCDVINAMGKENIQWIESYITEDKVYCKYLAINEDLLREHAERGGFPINKITQIQNRISPRTASDD